MMQTHRIRRFLTVLCSVAMLLSLGACGRIHAQPSQEAEVPASNLQSAEDPEPEKRLDGPQETRGKEEEEREKTVSMEDALFIGDSRTVGIQQCSDSPADFFATVGMSVSRIHDDTVEIPDMGTVTLTQLLQNKAYGKIYIMLGINEVGNDQETTIRKYADLLQEIRETQSNAELYLQANLHVSRHRSETSQYVTNERLDRLNAMIQNLAEEEGAHYLDINTEFDDESGALQAELTSDGIHPSAEYYHQWYEWIVSQSALT